MVEFSHSLSGATPGEYHSFLVRIHRSGPLAEWRGTVEVIATRQRYTVRSPEELLAFLNDQCVTAPSVVKAADG
jgi:hypothetical protein